jgi:hypothetical protein
MSEAAQLIRERAETYASDARKFRDSVKLGSPILTPEMCDYWARCYSVVADELRKVAAELPEPEPGESAGCSCCQARSLAGQAHHECARCGHLGKSHVTCNKPLAADRELEIMRAALARSR